MTRVEASPATFMIELNDLHDIGRRVDYLMVQGRGDVKVTTMSGDVLTLQNVPEYKEIPVAVLRVWATGTTALGIMGGTYGLPS